MSKLLYNLGNESLDEVEGGGFELLRDKSFLIHKVKKWWDVDIENTIFYDAYMIKHDLSPTEKAVVVIIGKDRTNLEFSLDNKGNYNFSTYTKIRRIGIFSEDLSTIYRDYTLPTHVDDSVTFTQVNPYPPFSITLLRSTTAPNGTYIVLKFSRSIVTPTAPLSAFTISNGVSNLPIKFAVALDDTISLTLDNVVIPNDANVTVNYTKPTSGAVIKDNESNELDSFSNFPVTNISTVPGNPPTYVSSIVLNPGNAIEVLFNEPLHNEVAPASSFTVVVNGSSINVLNAATSGKLVLLELASTLYKNMPVTVAYTKPSGNLAVKDEQGNLASSFSAKTVLNASLALEPKPELVRSEVSANGATLALVYDKVLANTPPALSAFTVKCDGKAKPPQSVAISMDLVVLTFAESNRIQKDQPVSVAYTKPSSGNIIQSAYLTPAESLPETTVTNNSTILLEILSDNLVLYLDASNNDSLGRRSDPNDNNWRDISSTNSSKVGTLKNGIAFNQANGGSLVFDGTNTVVEFDENDDFALGTGDFTIQYFIKIDTYKGNIVDFRPYGSAEGFLQYLNGDGKIAHWSQADENYYTGNTTLNKGTWLLLTFVRSGSTYTGYVNKQKDKTVTGITFNSTGKKLHIGSGTPPNAWTIHASIGLFVLYKGKALTESQVAQNYDVLSPRFTNT